MDPALAAEPQKQLVCTDHSSVVARNETLRRQRLLDRDRYYHKQLWTKDAHGGPYRKV